MAKQFLVDIDLVKNQLLNAVVHVLPTAPGTPTEGQIYYNSTDETLYIRTSGTWLDLSDTGAGATNLSFSRDGSTVTVESDTGTNTILPGATTSLAGVMIATDKVKLNGIETGADVTDSANVDAAGAVMNSDASTAAMSFVIDEGNMISNSATRVPTQQSVKTYVDNAVAGGMTFIGDYNAGTNSPNLTSSPVGVKKGDTYVISNPGTFFAESVQAGDQITAKQDDPTTLAHWTVVNKNIPDIVTASTTAQGIIELATQTEVNTGTDTTRAVTPATLQSKLGVTGTLNNAVRYTATIGNGALTTIVVTHNIGRQFLTAQVFQTASPYAQVECDIEMDTINATSFTFNTAPTSNQYTVVITG